MYRADTIVACGTAPGRAAIAIVRLSGPDCLAIATRLFEPHKAGALRPWQMRYGRVVCEFPIDDALAVFFPAPRTYTGEDMLELQCHGSPLIVEQVIAAAIACGARAADRGEFSRRAVLNGRMDLVQAEAVADLIDARMSAGARMAWAQLQGALSQTLAEIRSALLAVLADVEAYVDFTDDELPEESWPARTEALGKVAHRIEGLLGGYASARRQREGVRVVVTGQPNAGKSSLINRLLGSARMIVTDEPGTTRDLVEEELDLGGMAFVLTDTAGLRESDSRAETEAVARARGALQDADVVVLVIDGSSPMTPADRDLLGSLGEVQPIIALNKRDLGSAFDCGERAELEQSAVCVIETSAATGEGFASVAEALAEAGGRLTEQGPAGISRLRHRAAMERALLHLRAAQAAMTSDEGTEIAALELRASLHEIASITEVVGDEEVLDIIFREFCIGK